LQTQCLSVRESLLMDAQTRLIKYLEKIGKLDRTIEFLPSNEELALRKAAKRGLTSPERAVLLAYSKIMLYDGLLNSELPDDPYVSAALVRYFPTPVRERYDESMERHPLKREIIATQVTNDMVHRVGSTFLHRMQEETGARIVDVVRAYLLTREVFDFESFWHKVEALDNKAPDAVQSAMLIASERLMSRATRWFLRYRSLKEDLAKTVRYFAPKVKSLAWNLDEFLPGEECDGLRQAAERLTESKVPSDLAHRVVRFDSIYSALDIVDVAAATNRSTEEVAGAYFVVGERFNSSWLHRQIAALPADSHWQTLAKAALKEELSGLQRELSCAVLKFSRPRELLTEIISRWEAQNASSLERSRQVLADVQSADSTDLSMLSVALQELTNLVTNAR
jgi:glutamate dehydrogenase